MRVVMFLLIGLFVAEASAAAQLLRTGLQRVISPGKTTSDTLGFFPPDPGLRRIVQSVSVRIDSIDFPQDEALDISLIHAGVNDSLVHGLGFSGADFTHTMFDDTAAVPVSQGAPPFTGTFQPARSLAQFTGTDATGLWILRITNHSVDRMGILEEWGVGIDFTTVVTSLDAIPGGVPQSVQVDQNFPNPFNPSTTIRYGIPRKSHVTLTLFDLTGRKVATLVDGEEDAGYHLVRLDGAKLATGVYFYRLVAGSYAGTKRLIILR